MKLLHLYKPHRGFHITFVAQVSGETSLDVEVSQKVPGISSLPHGKLEQLLYEAVQWQGGTLILNFQLFKVKLLHLYKPHRGFI